MSLITKAASGGSALFGSLVGVDASDYDDDYEDRPAPAKIQAPIKAFAPTIMEAERALIGALLLDASVWDEVGAKLEAGDFSAQLLGKLFGLIGAKAAEAGDVDAITIADAAAAAGVSVSFETLADMMQACPAASLATEYAKIIRNASLRRKVAQAGAVLSSTAVRADVALEDLLAQGQSALSELQLSTLDAGGGLRPMVEVIAGVVGAIESAYERGGELIGVSSGFVDLDKKTGGLKPSDMIVVGARPAMGKTTFALNIAETVALEEREEVHIFSMEMSSLQIGMRFVSQLSRIDQDSLSKGNLNDDQWQQLTYAIGRLSEAPVCIDDTPGLTILELTARVRRRVKQTKRTPGLIVIDYLQLMSGSRKSDNRTQELSEISRGIKALAKEMNCPVIALSQLNRDLEKRADKRPIMADLRESGAIEQDADIIMFLYRDEYYNPDTTQDHGTAEVIIGKHRNGPVGTVRLAFEGTCTRFQNLAFGGGEQGY